MEPAERQNSGKTAERQQTQQNSAGTQQRLNSSSSDCAGTAAVLVRLSRAQPRGVRAVPRARQQNAHVAEEFASRRPPGPRPHTTPLRSFDNTARPADNRTTHHRVGVDDVDARVPAPRVDHSADGTGAEHSCPSRNHSILFRDPDGDLVNLSHRHQEHHQAVPQAAGGGRFQSLGSELSSKFHELAQELVES